MDDPGRRGFLHLLTGSMLIGAAGGSAWLLLDGLGPDADAAARMIVRYPLEQVEHQVTFAWRGRPLAILKRSPVQVAVLSSPAPGLIDPTSSDDQQPSYARNPFRSITPETFVFMPDCTGCGCAVVNQGDDFACFCCGAHYDLAGRAREGTPARKNLRVPPYRLDRDIVVVGETPWWSDFGFRSPPFGRV